MSKNIILCAAVPLILLVLGLVQERVRSSRLRSNTDALQVTPVDLSPLNPGEIREFKVFLRNTGLRPISLLPPKSDCGCICHNANRPLTVPGEGSIEIPFSLRAPPWPGSLSKRILLAVEDSAGATWQVPITACVVAKAWAVPPALDLSCDQAPVLEPSVAVYHDEQTRIGAVVSSSPAITVKTDQGGLNRVGVDLTICPPPMKGGETWQQTLQVFDQKDNSELLRIPVRVACPPELQCIPEQLVLNNRKEPGDWLERKVLVLVRSDVPSVLEAKPLFSWVHVESPERRSRGFSVRLRFDKKAMPADFHENIVRFALEGKEYSVFLPGLSTQ
jgi:hypothetical protein